MSRPEIELAVDQLDAFVRQQQRRCRVEHRHVPRFVRMHPRDYELLMIDARYVAQWSATEEWYRNMRMRVDVACVDGPVVECDAFWDHGRQAPIDYRGEEHEE